MKRLLVFSLAIIILTGCAGENSSDVLSSVNAADASLVSNSVSQSVESEMAGRPASKIDAAHANTGPNTAPEIASAIGEKTAGSEGVVSSGERTDKYFSDGPAALSWRTAYESFYSGGVKLTPGLIDKVWMSRY